MKPALVAICAFHVLLLHGHVSVQGDKRAQDSVEAEKSIKRLFDTAKQPETKWALSVALQHLVDINMHADKGTLTRDKAFDLGEQYLRSDAFVKGTPQTILLVGATYIPPNSKMTIGESHGLYIKRLNEKK